MQTYFEQDGLTIYHGDFREVVPTLAPVDCIIADPPYGVTNLAWDHWIKDFPQYLAPVLKRTGSFWCFGSFRVFFEHAAEFKGWRVAQEIVWEKHNGSAMHSDRFRRVHELVVQFYRGPWAGVYKAPVFTRDARRRKVSRSQQPAHMHGLGRGFYQTEEGGPRLMRSVIYARSAHGQAHNPTQKPEPVTVPLIEYASPPGGVLLDPTMGSGSFLMCAKKLGRRAIGIDLRESECDQAARWLSQKVQVFDGA